MDVVLYRVTLLRYFHKPRIISFVVFIFLLNVCLFVLVYYVFCIFIVITTLILVFLETTPLQQPVLPPLSRRVLFGAELLVTLTCTFVNFCALLY